MAIFLGGVPEGFLTSKSDFVCLWVCAVCVTETCYRYFINGHECIGHGIPENQGDNASLS